MRKCRGACVGEESPEAHHLRLATALEAKRIPDWPFAGPVAIVERDAARGIEEAHVIDRWRHLGTARDEDELASLAATRRLPEFDPGRRSRCCGAGSRRTRGGARLLGRPAQASASTSGTSLRGLPTSFEMARSSHRPRVGREQRLRLGGRAR